MKGIPDAGFWLAISTAWQHRTNEADQSASIGMTLLLMLATIGVALLVGGTAALVAGCALGAVWPIVWVLALWDEGRSILRHTDRPNQ